MKIGRFVVAMSVLLCCSGATSTAATVDVIEDGLDYLESVQLFDSVTGDGYWTYTSIHTPNDYPCVAVTSLALLAFLNHGTYDYNSTNTGGIEFIRETKEFIVGCVQPDCSIQSPKPWPIDWGAGGKPAYETSSAIVALIALRNVKPSLKAELDPIIMGAKNYLLCVQTLPSDIDVSGTWYPPNPILSCQGCACAVPDGAGNHEIHGGLGCPSAPTNTNWGGWRYPGCTSDTSNSQFVAWALFACNLVADGHITPNAGANRPCFEVPQQRLDQLLKFIELQYMDDPIHAGNPDVYKGITYMQDHPNERDRPRGNTCTQGLWSMFCGRQPTDPLDPSGVLAGAGGAPSVANGVYGWLRNNWEPFPNDPKTWHYGGGFKYVWLWSYAKAMSMMELFTAPTPYVGFPPFPPEEWHDCPAAPGNDWYTGTGADPTKELETYLVGAQILPAGNWPTTPYADETFATVFAIMSLQQKSAGKNYTGSPFYDVIFWSPVEAYVEYVENGVSKITGVKDGIRYTQIDNSDCSQIGDEPFEIHIGLPGLETHYIHMKGLETGTFSITQQYSSHDRLISEYIAEDIPIGEDEEMVITAKISNTFGVPVILTAYPYHIEPPPPGPPAIEATVEIKPETLKLSSKGDFTAFVKLPEGYSVSDVDIDTVVCEGASALTGNVAKNTLVVKFDRKDLVDISPGNEVTFTVTGQLADETAFSGSDVIRVLE